MPLRRLDFIAPSSYSPTNGNGLDSLRVSVEVLVDPRPGCGGVVVVGSPKALVDPGLSSGDVEVHDN